MILALDIGKNTAWARSDGTSGHRVFADDDHGLALANFTRWLGRMLDDNPPIYLAVERAFVGRNNNPNLRLTGAMELTAHALAAARDIPRTDRSAMQVRMYLLGFGLLPPSDDSKAQRTRDLDKLVLAAVRARGFRPHALTAHALIQGAFVAVLTGSVGLGVAETIAHWCIDWLKCEGKIGLHTDQALHVACKLLWLIILVGPPA